LIDDYKSYKQLETREDQKNLTLDCINYVNDLLPTLYKKLDWNKFEGPKFSENGEKFTSNLKVLEKILEFLITVLSARFARVNTLLLIHDKLFMLKLKIYLRLVCKDPTVDKTLANFKHL
jgi:hypothetical protein